MIFDLVVAALLSPLLLVQAAYVRSRALALPEPPGGRAGVVGQGAPLRVLILGDSSAAGVGVEAQDDALLGQITHRLAGHATVTFELVAQTGAKTGDVLAWLDELPSQDYDVVITALGVNDVTKLVPLRRWLQQQETLMGRLVNDFGARCVIVSGVPNLSEFPVLPNPLRWLLGRRAVWLDHYLAPLVDRQPHCIHVPADMTLTASNMARDGFHPGPIVYAAWAEMVVAAILQDPALLDPVAVNA